MNEGGRLGWKPAAVLVVAALALGPLLWLVFPRDSPRPKPESTAPVVCTAQAVNNTDPFAYESADLPQTGFTDRRLPVTRLRHGLVHNYLVVFYGPDVPRSFARRLARLDTARNPAIVTPAPDGAPFSLSGSIAGSQISCPDFSPTAQREFAAWIAEAQRR